MTNGTGIWAGLTMSELIEIVLAFLQEASQEYEDDHKLTIHEIIKILGPGEGDAKPGLFLNLASHADGVAATAFNAIGNIMTWILPLIPGAD